MLTARARAVSLSVLTARARTVSLSVLTARVRTVSLSVLTAWASGRAWRELAYLVGGVFVGVLPFALALVAVVASALSVLTVGLPVLVGVLALGRLLPRWFRGPARLLLDWEWENPPRLPARTLWGRIRALPGDPTAWRALAYSLAHWPVMVAGAYAGLVGVVLGPLGLTYPLWWLVVPRDWPVFDSDTWTGTLRIALQGAAVVLATPWWVRVMVLIDRFLVRGLLHPSRSQQRIAALEAGRAALQSDAAALLRRVERDLHDGTQARLVALGLTLSRIESRSTEEPVRTLAADARGSVTEALTELRDIVRGMHPPALDDGLEVALASLAARSAVPVQVSVALAGRPPDATASALYFAVAELLTNIARHSGATRARVELRSEHHRLHLTVTDNGRGGAATRDGPANGGGAAIRSGAATGGSGVTSDGGAAEGGTGLAGLRRRAAALDGEFTVDSPPGGPTVVTMVLPEGD
ncbi:sensor domain-containing protein [Actinoplanes sp. NPDC049596]|uniref:sensor histidine kinase n=1 Tax=unclassified Actinoplanes TaxID=2626549 RepID=UPI00343981F8